MYHQTDVWRSPLAPFTRVTLHIVLSRDNIERVTLTRMTNETGARHQSQRVVVEIIFETPWFSDTQ